ncbi:MAG TPA: nitrogen fixation protein NifQ, partial [Betaproteobacteria bacterium]|nr:nitrogen fixation protein NifQ [Betaproteobacteria bacterium]
MTARWRYDWLLARARDPVDIVTYAFAGAIDTSAAALPAPRRLGLAPARFAALLTRYFPQAAEVFSLLPSETGDFPLRNDEFEDLLQLLRDHGSRRDEENEWLAHAVAAAC